MNQINAIKLYLWNGLWVFDDQEKGLDKEALIAGMPEIIKEATKQLGIVNSQNGFLVLFSKDPFPSVQIVLERVRAEGSGNVYEWNNLEGWLCPALLKYFDVAPERIYVELQSIPEFNVRGALRP